MISKRVIALAIVACAFLVLLNASLRLHYVRRAQADMESATRESVSQSRSLTGRQDGLPQLPAANNSGQANVSVTNNMWTYYTVLAAILACTVTAGAARSWWPFVGMSAYVWLLNGAASGLILQNGALIAARVLAPLGGNAPAIQPLGVYVLLGLYQAFPLHLALPVVLGIWAGTAVRRWRQSVHDLVREAEEAPVPRPVTFDSNRWKCRCGMLNAATSVNCYACGAARFGAADSATAATGGD